MFVRNCWYVAGWSSEFEIGRPAARTILDQPLVLYRRGNGAVVALEDRCCHRLAPLSKGRLEGDDLRCMYHGMKFAPDGRCIEIPGQDSIPEKARVRAWPAVERGAWTWVWMGAAERADPALIPLSVAAEDPAWRIRTGHLDYEADYWLINDNLVDLSHLSFTHENTLGRGMPQWAAQRPTISRLAHGLRFQRWIRGVDAEHFLGHLGKIFDIWHSYDYLVPGVFLQRTNFHGEGAAERAGGRMPSEPPLFSRLDEQAVTPTGSATARYFFAAGTRHEDAGPAFIDRLFQHALRAFAEDKEIIEAQYRQILRDPTRPMIATSFDAGPNLFRGLMKGLIERETDERQAVAAA